MSHNVSFYVAFPGVLRGRWPGVILITDSCTFRQPPTFRLELIAKDLPIHVYDYYLQLQYNIVALTYPQLRNYRLQY